MTKFFSLSLLFLVFQNSIASATEIDMATKVESVTIYHSGALVERSAVTNLKQGVNELMFKNLSSKIILNSLKIKNKEITILNKSVLRKLTKEEFSSLLDKKESLNKQLALIEVKFNEEGFVSKVEDLEKMTAFYGKKTLSIKKQLRNIEGQIKEAKKLENIKLENENAAILKLIVSVNQKLSAPLQLKYICGGIGWSPSYEINVESSFEKNIEIKYLAKTMSQTGENWNNVTINLSSAFPLEAPTKLPKSVGPWVLSSRRSANYAQNQTTINTQKRIDKLEGVEYQQINIPSFLKMRTLSGKYSIKSNSTIFTFPIKTVNLPTNYKYYAYPKLDQEVYLVANITNWDTLGFIDGVANITYGGNDVGKSIIKFSEANDTLMLPIGKDNSVYLSRKEIADQKYFKETKIGKKKKMTLAFRYELNNNNPFPIEFELIDQVPISQTKSASVEIIKTSKANIAKETGEVTWQLNLTPGKTVSKELIFMIETESGYKYRHTNSKKKFTPVSSPSF